MIDLITSITQNEKLIPYKGMDTNKVVEIGTHTIIQSTINYMNSNSEFTVDQIKLLEQKLKTNYYSSEQFINI